MGNRAEDSGDPPTQTRSTAPSAKRRGRLAVCPIGCTWCPERGLDGGSFASWSRAGFRGIVELHEGDGHRGQRLHRSLSSTPPRARLGWCLGGDAAVSSPTRVEERPVAVADNDLHAWTLAVSRDRIIVAVWTAATCLAAVEAWFVLHGSWGWDSVTYWSVWSQPTMYGIAPHTQGAYLYSPAFAQVIYPLTPSSAQPVHGAVARVRGLCVLLDDSSRRLGVGVPLAALALEDLRVGNITWLVALSLVLGLRRSPVWLVPALTKVTPAVVVLWLVPRREWRELLVFVGAALAVHGCLGQPRTEPVGRLGRVPHVPRPPHGRGPLGSRGRPRAGRKQT